MEKSKNQTQNCARDKIAGQPKVTTGLIYLQSELKLLFCQNCLVFEVVKCENSTLNHHPYVNSVKSQWKDPNYNFRKPKVDTLPKYTLFLSFFKFLLDSTRTGKDSTARGCWQKWEKFEFPCLQIRKNLLWSADRRLCDCWKVWSRKMTYRSKQRLYSTGSRAVVY